MISYLENFISFFCKMGSLIGKLNQAHPCKVLAAAHSSDQWESEVLRKHQKAEVDCRCLPRQGGGPGEQGGLSQMPMGARFACEPSEISLHPLQGWGTRDQLFLFSEST